MFLFLLVILGIVGLVVARIVTKDDDDEIIPADFLVRKLNLS